MFSGLAKSLSRELWDFYSMSQPFLQGMMNQTLCIHSGKFGFIAPMIETTYAILRVDIVMVLYEPKPERMVSKTAYAEQKTTCPTLCIRLSTSQ